MITHHIHALSHAFAIMAGNSAPIGKPDKSGLLLPISRLFRYSGAIALLPIIVNVAIPPFDHQRHRSADLLPKVARLNARG